jgi:protein disulfide-isomerase A1
MLKSLLLASYAAATLVTAEHLQDPGEEDFKSILDLNEQVLVSFTSRSLDSVTAFNDLFHQTSKNASTPFVTVDCDQAHPLCASYDVNSYPTIRHFKRAEHGAPEQTRYRGPRTPKALFSFLKKRELPILTQLKDGEESFRQIDDIVFLAILDDADNAHLDAYSAIAHKHHLDYVFAYTNDPLIAEKEKVRAPTVICFRNNDGDNVMLEGTFTEADAENFVRKSRDSVMKEFREKDMETFMQRDKLTVYLFTRSTDVTQTLRYELISVAKALEKYVTFATVDVGRYPEMPKNFGTEMGGEVVVVVHAPMNDNLFFWEKGRKVEREGVENMLMTILEGRAVQGQVFGEGADDAGGVVREGHDEL